MSDASQSPLTRRALIGLVVLVFAFAISLRLMGREYLSDSGFGFWTGAWTTHTSQWMVDPYSTSHILHGIFFYWLLLPTARWVPGWGRLLLAAGIEIAWELVENSPLVIDRYRQATASLDYYGDSIMNSLCDLLAALVGYLLAWRFGWTWMLALVIVIESAMLGLVRDNLTLNVLMLFHPFESIKQWQLGR